MQALITTCDEKLFVHELEESPPVLLLRGRLFGRLAFNIDPIDGSVLILYQEFPGNFDGLMASFQKMRSAARDYE